MRASAATSRQAPTARGHRARVGGIIALVLAVVATFAARCPAATIVVAQNQPVVGAMPATPPATPNEDQHKDGSKAPKNVEPLPWGAAASVLGKKVMGPTGESLGMMVDVLVDPDGRPRAAVIDFGGFLGVGSRKIAIDWKALDFKSLGRAGTAELGLTRAQIAATPE